MHNNLLNTRLALGTVQFGLDYGISNKFGKTESSEVKKIVATALHAGIDTLDTANAYGNSEQVLGNINCSDFKIVSKFSSAVITPEELESSLSLSLRHLKVTSLYGFLAHDADQLIKHSELWKDMLALKEKKLTKKIGYSLYTTAQLEKLLELKCIPEIVQVPYSYVDRRFEKHFEQLKSLGCEIHVRSAFLQGLFFLDPTDLHPFFEPVKPLLNKLRDSFSSNEEIAGFLMHFVLNNKNVDKLVFGVETEAHLIQNLKNLEMNTTTVGPEFNETLPLEILLPAKWPK